MAIPHKNTGASAVTYPGTGTRSSFTHATPDTPTKGGDPADPMKGWPSVEVWDKMVNSTKSAAALNDLQTSMGLTGFRDRHPHAQSDEYHRKLGRID